MKKNIVKIALCAVSFVTLSFSMTGCKEWLTAPEPGQVKLEDFFTSKAAAQQCVKIVERLPVRQLPEQQQIRDLLEPEAVLLQVWGCQSAQPEAWLRNYRRGGM